MRSPLTYCSLFLDFAFAVSTVISYANKAAFTSIIVSLSLRHTHTPSASRLGHAARA